MDGDRNTRFLKGGQRELSYFKEKARKSRVEFRGRSRTAGANADSVTIPILHMLATTELFLKKNHGTPASRVIVNAWRVD